MNILVLNTGRGWGGIESHSIILAKSLIKFGYNVLLGCRQGRVVYQNAVENSIPVVHVRMANAADVFSVMRIVRLVRENNIDIIVSNLGKEYWPATLAAKLSGAKILLVRHQLDPIKKTTRWLMEHYVDKIAAVTNAVKDVMINSGVPDEKVTVINPGQELEKFTNAAKYRQCTREEFGIKSDDIVVASAGKLHHGKGIFELLQAAEVASKKHPNIKVMYIGDGPEQDQLKDMIDKLGMEDRVIMAGFRTDIERLYSAIDIFVLPSKLYESFGMVLIEAMAAGKPVIGTAVGGIPEIISNGQNGILVAPGEHLPLAEAIDALVSRPDMAEEFVAESNIRLNENFTAEASSKKFVKLMQNMLGS